MALGRPTQESCNALYEHTQLNLRVLLREPNCTPDLIDATATCVITALKLSLLTDEHFQPVIKKLFSEIMYSNVFDKVADRVNQQLSNDELNEAYLEQVALKNTNAIDFLSYCEKIKTHVKLKVIEEYYTKSKESPFHVIHSIKNPTIPEDSRLAKAVIRNAYFCPRDLIVFILYLERFEKLDLVKADLTNTFTEDEADDFLRVLNYIYSSRPDVIEQIPAIKKIKTAVILKTSFYTLLMEMKHATSVDDIISYLESDAIAHLYQKEFIQLTNLIISKYVSIPTKLISQFAKQIQRCKSIQNFMQTPAIQSTMGDFLLVSAESNVEDAVEHFLQINAPITKTTKDGKTLIDLAISHNNTRMIQMLLEADLRLANSLEQKSESTDKTLIFAKHISAIFVKFYNVKAITELCLNYGLSEDALIALIFQQKLEMSEIPYYLNKIKIQDLNENQFEKLTYALTYYKLKDDDKKDWSSLIWFANKVKEFPHLQTPKNLQKLGTALYVAASHNQADVVAALLDANAPASACSIDKPDSTSLECAIQNRNPKLIEILINALSTFPTHKEQKSEPYTYTQLVTIFQRYSDNEAIRNICLYKNVVPAKILLDALTQNAINDGWFVEWLNALPNNPQLNQAYKQTLEKMLIASEQNQNYIVKAFIISTPEIRQELLNLHRQFGSDALNVLCNLYSPAKVIDMLQTNAYEKCLLEAVEQKNIYAVEKILQKYPPCFSSDMIKVMMSQTDTNGETVLHRAVRDESYRMIKLLLDAGADPKFPNLQGQIPAELANSENELLIQSLCHFELDTNQKLNALLGTPEEKQGIQQLSQNLKNAEMRKKPHAHKARDALRIIKKDKNIDAILERINFHKKNGAHAKEIFFNCLAYLNTDQDPSQFENAIRGLDIDRLRISSKEKQKLRILREFIARNLQELRNLKSKYSELDSNSLILLKLEDQLSLPESFDLATKVEVENLIETIMLDEMGMSQDDFQKTIRRKINVVGEITHPELPKENIKESEHKNENLSKALKGDAYAIRQTADLYWKQNNYGRAMLFSFLAVVYSNRETDRLKFQHLINAYRPSADNDLIAMKKFTNAACQNSDIMLTLRNSKQQHSPQVLILVAEQLARQLNAYDTALLPSRLDKSLELTIMDLGNQNSKIVRNNINRDKATAKEITSGIQIRKQALYVSVGETDKNAEVKLSPQNSPIVSMHVENEPPPYEEPPSYAQSMAPPSAPEMIVQQPYSAPPASAVFAAPSAPPMPVSQGGMFAKNSPVAAANDVVANDTEEELTPTANKLILNS